MFEVDHEQQRRQGQQKMGRRIVSPPPYKTSKIEPELNVEVQKACMRDLYKLAKSHGAGDGRPMPDAATMEKILQAQERKKQRKILKLEAKLIEAQRQKQKEFERADIVKEQQMQQKMRSPVSVADEFSSFQSSSNREVDIVDSTKETMTDSFSLQSFKDMFSCQPKDWSSSVVMKELKKDLCFCAVDPHLCNDKNKDMYNYPHLQKVKENKKSTKEDIGNMVDNSSKKNLKKQKVLLVGDHQAKEMDQLSSSRPCDEQQATEQKDHKCSDENLDKILQMVDQTFDSSFMKYEDVRSDEISSGRARRTVEKYAKQTGLTVEELLLEVESEYTASTRGQQQYYDSSTIEI